MKNDLADEGIFSEDDVVFLTVDQVISLHAESIKRYSPAESFHILDKGLLESAVMTPQQTFGGQYLYQTLPETAAAYMVGLVLNHAFENGNKRIGFAACSTFLRLLHLPTAEWIPSDIEPGRSSGPHVAPYQP